ncbi:ParB/RepB/Spo0J family partition protein [Syntrophomonas wolfei]|uniref:Chromosome segregation DNA-binding protein / transcriptional regulator n=1 Tax=Syntrophomonas wolfei subsp. wolfei (strain DSM 2245B / Goettingen) TaxID=335541 RepID=Q0ATV0_SYNWW|nr:ParB/RepB/Spo0J family partition protein [Syntrophomonas wolfei]ABI69854.1 chromosome segregation DNA-binding protein / transcriptional regulator [Syntrophomonas wolfei subsp. wolfei str. Goettingen G311]
MQKKGRGLGRGLEALLSNELAFDETQELTQIKVDEIVLRKDQPRKNFDEKSLQELADSIQEHGLLQPLIVRHRQDGFELVAGERRWRAAQIAGLIQVPALIREMDDVQAAEVSLVENIQRDDLSAVEEAMAYKYMMDNYGYTQEVLAEKLGKSRPHIANMVRMLALPEQVLTMLERQEITAGHARAILSLPTAAEQIAAAKEIVAGRLSVRETEKKAKSIIKRKQVEKKRDPVIMELEERMESYFSSRTKVMQKGRGGTIEISFYSLEDLERIVELIGLE